MSVADEFLAANAAYAEALPTADRAAPPSRNLAVLACMDARLRPEDALGLELGEAHVIRNAGGRASDDALRSLALSSHLLGTRTFFVIHHTECGLLGTTNDAIRDRIHAATGTHPQEIDFLPFEDAGQALQEDVERIRTSELFDGSIVVVGMTYDVRTGRLEVAVPA